MTPENAFSPTIPRQAFLETLGTGEALRRLGDGLGSREPFLLVTGEAGTGKSTLAGEALARWEGRVTAAWVAYPALAGDELLEEILRRFGAEAPEGAGRPKRIACLEAALAGIAERGQVAMVVVDDAHDLSPGALEELRLLVNAAQQARRPLEVLLVGLPALETRLGEPALAALGQRVSVRARLEPLTAGETRRYIRHRVTVAGGDAGALFPRRACVEIAALAQGLPRRINALACEALRLALAAGAAAVEDSHVRTAAAALSGALPRDEAADAAEEECEEPLEAAAAAPVEVATPAAVTPAATPALPPARAEVPPPAPARPARAAAAARARAQDRPAAAPDAGVAPPPTASQDPREWVRRFVGDRGPLQIGSRASADAGGPPEGGAAVGLAMPGAAEPGRGRKVKIVWERGSSRSRRGVPTLAIAGALATIAVVVAATLLVRAGARARAGGAKAAGEATSAAVAPPSAPAPAARGTAEAPQPSAKTEPAAAAAPARPRGPWTLEVGAHADLQRALDERDRLQMLTGIDGWVAFGDEDRGQPHRIVLGIYRSHTRAKRAADMLVRTRTLPRVEIVTLPPNSERR